MVKVTVGSRVNSQVWPSLSRMLRYSGGRRGTEGFLDLAFDAFQGCRMSRRLPPNTAMRSTRDNVAACHIGPILAGSGRTWEGCFGGGSG